MFRFLYVLSVSFLVFFTVVATVFSVIIFGVQFIFWQFSLPGMDMFWFITRIEVIIAAVITTVYMLSEEGRKEWRV